ncbi:citrate synthase family protein [Catenuloplanes indicus]|uniref:citrate synthase (unknown stereospecificity) n=1 Tax=Catenuloplanes indicus TaxID=137267 RepID=A0AAE4AV55_9ACTN|nr:citrate synthase family protein [Catenuloplanes indicus]MDQ0363632.1 citrate synthase [Catenuloplanes indicus]
MRMLTTDEVARRLGVKRATVYAYVSRGLLAGRRNAQGKETLFAEADVHAFEATRGPRAVDRPGSPAVHTGITLITADTLFYRGHDVSELAREEQYEAVARLLWTGELDDMTPFPQVAPWLETLARDVTRPLPATARLTDRLRIIVAALGAADPLRLDTTPAAVIATAQTLLQAMVSALPQLSVPGDAGLAALLWSRLTAKEPSYDDLYALNAAMVLLADHDLAASTFAARVAASTRAHPYAVVGAGLAAMDGPLHGAASGLATEMLRTAISSGSALGAISDRLRTGGGVPGFGHPLYPAGDPRASTLLGLLPAESVEAQAVTAVAEAMRARAGVAPNIDLALAAFTLRHEMPGDAGEAIFAVARTAGWIAHAIEEYADQPSRFRPTGRYAGLPPLNVGTLHP